ncbi:MAG TPA: TIGR03792 family protein [Anaerolineae bacterium]|nr:TIGR03792 family protein [Anaerolineae bacterium]HMR66840.1 TIGR03792 family protein [Anaerolineae bacterium]
MIDQKLEKGYAVEYLIFDVKPDLIDKFIEMDHDHWTLFLKDQPGFVSKELWVNRSKPGEVTAVICWHTMEEWKAIPLEKLIETDRRFTELFGPENFQLVKADHLANERYKVREYRITV